MTITEFVQKTHTVLHDENHFEMHFPVCKQAERQELEGFAKEHKSEILHYLHNQAEKGRRQETLEKAVRKIRNIEKIWEQYDYDFQMFLKSEINDGKPKIPPITVKEAIDFLNPKEQAYLQADRYAQSGNFDKAEIGVETKAKIAECDSTLPEVYESMIQEMRERWLKICKK